MWSSLATELRKSGWNLLVTKFIQLAVTAFLPTLCNPQDMDRRASPKRCGERETLFMYGPCHEFRMSRAAVTTMHGKLCRGLRMRINNHVSLGVYITAQVFRGRDPLRA